MLIESLKKLLDLWVQQGTQVERYYGGSDKELKEMLEIAGYQGQAACASVCYWWIRRHLTYGIISSPEKPAFAKSNFDIVEKWIVAKKQTAYSKAHQSVDTPYESMIDEKDALIHSLVSKENFKPWGSIANSDTNISAVVKALKNCVESSYKSEAEMRNILTSDLDQGHPWKNKSIFESDFNQAADCYFILSVKTTVFGHSMAIRYEACNGVIHFVDPNLGHFKFIGWTALEQNLQHYWICIWMHEVDKVRSFPPKFRFLQHRVYQFRRAPKYKDIADFFVWRDI